MEEGGKNRSGQLESTDTGKRQVCFHHVLCWVVMQIIELVRREAGPRAMHLLPMHHMRFCSSVYLAALRFSSLSGEGKSAQPSLLTGLL